MMMKLRKIWANINLLRAFPALIAFYFSPQKELIKKDLDRWAELKKCEYKSIWNRMNWFFLYYPEYRNLYYSRIRRDLFIFSKILPLFYKPLPLLYIFVDDIGGGLFIQHGFSTGISAKSIGECCWINQQVTIGYLKSSSDNPTIGNNVRIGAGAIIMGDIKIGDNSIIGANAVVTKDVPANCIVAGSPSYIIKKDNEKVNILL